MKVNRVAGIVLKNNKILLMFRRNHGKEYFTFPGGGVEAGETDETALVREMMEETSINVKVVKLLYHVEWNQETFQNFYLCEYLSGEPLLGDSNEIETMKDDENQYYEPKWIEINELSKKLLYPLEVRDKLINNLATEFLLIVTNLQLDINTCRQAL